MSLLGKKFPAPVGTSIGFCRLCATVGTSADEDSSSANGPVLHCWYAQPGSNWIHRWDRKEGTIADGLQDSLSYTASTQEPTQ
jgi:hypothetical protein